MRARDYFCSDLQRTQLVLQPGDAELGGAVTAEVHQLVWSIAAAALTPKRARNIDPAMTNGNQ